MPASSEGCGEDGDNDYRPTEQEDLLGGVSGDESPAGGGGDDDHGNSSDEEIGDKGLSLEIEWKLPGWQTWIKAIGRLPVTPIAHILEMLRLARSKIDREDKLKAKLDSLPRAALTTVAGLKSKVKYQGQKIGRLQAESAVKAASLKSFSVQNEELRRQVRIGQTKLEAAEKLGDEARSAVAELESRNAALETRIGNMQGEFAQLGAKAQKLESECRSLRGGSDST